MDVQLCSICGRLLADSSEKNNAPSVYVVTEDGRILGYSSRTQQDLASVGTLLAALINVLEKLYGRPLHQTIRVGGEGVAESFVCHPLEFGQFLIYQNLVPSKQSDKAVTLITNRLRELDQINRSGNTLDELTSADLKTVDGFREGD